MRKKLSKVKMKPLPNKLGKLLKLALDDFEVIQSGKYKKYNRYIIDMGHWHTALRSRKETSCFVCLAGCVITRHSNIPIQQSLDIGLLTHSVRAKMYTLDQLRRFNIHTAFELMHALQDDKVITFINLKGALIYALKERHDDDASDAEWLEDMRILQNILLDANL